MEELMLMSEMDEEVMEEMNWGLPVEKVNRSEVLEVFRNNVVGLDDYNDIINFITTIAFEASHNYKKDGCKYLAERTANVAMGLHDLLENIGYFDDIRGRKVI